MEKKVLVVDDEEFILTLIEFNLQQAGFEVITAMDGEMVKICYRTPRFNYIRFNASKNGWYGSL